MAPSFRNVIARYQDEPQNQGPYEEDPDWVTNQKMKTQSGPKPAKVIFKMLDQEKIKEDSKEEMRDTDKPITVNPYDYDSPNTAPKDQEDSAPFENSIPYEIDQGHYSRPKVFEEDKPLDYWRKVREEDWTYDEDQQSPAISQTRTPGSGRCASFSKVASSLSEVISRDTHYKHSEKEERAQSSKASLHAASQEVRDSGLYTFSVTSPQDPKSNSTTKGPYKVNIQFLRPRPGTAKPKRLKDYPMQLSCTCPSFLFHGAQYYAIHGGYLYGPGIPSGRRSRNIAPTPENQISSTRFKSNSNPNRTSRNNPGRGVNFTVCKHILAAANLLESKPDLLRVKIKQRSLPKLGPPLPMFNKEIWEELMGFKFDLNNIKRILKSPKPVIPSFYKTRVSNRKFIEWMRDVWMPRSDEDKVKVLETMVTHPEEIFLILLKDAYYSNGKLSDYLINAGFNIMDKVVQENTPTPKPSKEEIAEKEKEQQEDSEDMEKSLLDNEEVNNLAKIPNNSLEDLEEPDKEEDTKEDEEDEEDEEVEEDISSPSKVEKSIKDVPSAIKIKE